ncbi:hypothetical protein [Pacificispira sp.]|uniref:hypothetical protein n=1 Tax=Pacificispira sp. TaxID=2888761 RepID=UPI003BAAEFA5
MLDIIWTIAPIFLLIVLGNLLRRNGIPSVEFWNLKSKNLLSGAENLAFHRGGTSLGQH